MNVNKKIVLLTPGFPADENDLACTTYLQDLVLSYKHYYPQANIEVITFQYPFRTGNYLWNGMKVYSAGGANSKILRLLTWRKVLKRLNQIQDEGKIDIIHSFWLTECTYIGQRFCSKNNIKHVASVLGQDVKKENKYLDRIDPDKLTVVSTAPQLSELFFAVKNRKVKTMIPWGIDPQKLILTTSVERTIDVIGVGSLNPLKDYSMFIDIIHELKKYFPKINACIIGKGEQMEMLRAKIERCGLKENMEMKGELPPKKVFEWMCRSRVFLHTSSFEGQSMVMSEALYAGLRIVCFDVVSQDEKDRILICDNKQIMVMALKRLMKEKLEHPSVKVQLVEETAQRYFEIYQ